MSGKAVNSLGFVLCENRSGGKVTLSEHEVQMEFTETRRGGDLNRLVNELTIEEKKRAGLGRGSVAHGGNPQIEHPRHHGCGRAPMACAKKKVWASWAWAEVFPPPVFPPRPH